MKVGDLVNVQTYRNSGETEAVGIFLGYTNEIRKKRAFVHVRGSKWTVPMFLLEKVNEGR